MTPTPQQIRDDGNQPLPPQDPLKLIADTVKALEDWGKYGEAMKAHGRGHDGACSALGISNNYLIASLQLLLKTHAQLSDKDALDIARKALS